MFPFSYAEATTAVVQHSGMCLDVRGGPQAIQDGAPIEQWGCSGASNQWRLEYSTASAPAVPTPNVTNTNTGTLKTATFTLSDASFRNAQQGGMDFRIYNNGAADVVMRSVRVIRGGP